MENNEKTVMRKTPETRIVNHGYPKELEIGVVDQAITFIQKSDTCDDDRWQQVTMQTCGIAFDERDNTDSFIRVSIGPREAGEEDIAPFWSCNGPEELVILFNELAKRTGMSCRWRLEKYHVQPITDLKEVIQE